MALLDSRAGALTFIVALAPSLVLLCCPSVFAVPMRFSGEQNTCIANCKKKSRSLVPINLCN
ncbi:MAG: hypothetical protein WCF76_16865, partial [Pseudolabrys sp.]